MPFSDIPNSLVGFLSASAVLLFIHPLVTLGVSIFSIPQFFLNSRFIKKEYELSTELSPLRKTWGWLEGYLLRNRSFLELKLLNLQGYLAHKLKRVVEEVVDKWVDLSKRREFSRFWGRVPLSVFELGITIVLVYWVILQRITIGTFQLYVRTLRLAEDNLASLVTSFLEIYENYIYVNDLVKIIAHFIDHEPNEQFYNAGQGQGVELLRLAELVKTATGSKLDIKIKRPGLGPEYSCNNSLLMNELGNFNFTPFETAIAEMVGWYKNN